jgi:30S ribosomal protein S31
VEGFLTNATGLIYIKTYYSGGSVMGKGDRRTKRGKIWRGTTGKHRAKKKKKEDSQKSD